jgi:polyhydroxybutyrate depolymerase
MIHFLPLAVDLEEISLLEKRTMMVRILLGVLCLLVFSLIPAFAQQNQSQVSYIQFEHDDKTREARLFLPSAYAENPEASFPLIIVYHSAGGSHDSMVGETHFDEYGEQDGVIIAYANSVLGYWDYGIGLPEWENTGRLYDDLGFSDLLYTHLLENYRIDPSRVYLAGYSQGSRMVMRLACEYPGRFAGAAIVAAGLSSEVYNICPKEAQLAIYYQHGTDDTSVPFDGEAMYYGERVIGYKLSAADTTTFWAIQNGCELTPEVTTLEDLNPEDAVVVRRALFNDCTSGFSVEFDAVILGGHGWLGSEQPIETDWKPSGDTSAAIWSFFDLGDS